MCELPRALVARRPRELADDRDARRQRASGRTPFSLRSSTIPAAPPHGRGRGGRPRRRSRRAGRAGEHPVARGRPRGRRRCRAPTRRAGRPATAATSCASVRPPLDGISRSSPAATPATRSLTAPQSDIDEPLEAPLVAQHRRQQPRVLRRVDAVDAVVRAHHRPRLRGLDDPLEAAQVDLAQRPLVDVGADPHAGRSPGCWRRSA